MCIHKKYCMCVCVVFCVCMCVGGMWMCVRVVVCGCVGVCVCVIICLCIYFVCGCNTREARVLERIDGKRTSEQWKKLVTLNNMREKGFFGRRAARTYDEEEKKLINPEGLENDNESEWEDEVDEYNNRLEENAKLETLLKKKKEKNKFSKETAKLAREVDEYMMMEIQVKGPKADPNWKHAFGKMKQCR